MDKITTSNLPSLIGGRGIGFDRMFNLIDDAIAHSGTSFPPYNIIQMADNDFVVEVALAGFTLDDLEIMQNGNKLTIEGRKPEYDENATTTNEPLYLHRGISGRAFTREFVLAEHIKVEDASFKDGILSINLHRDVPEALKPRVIEIK